MTGIPASNVFAENSPDIVPYGMALETGGICVGFAANGVGLVTRGFLWNIGDIWFNESFYSGVATSWVSDFITEAISTSWVSDFVTEAITTAWASDFTAEAITTAWASDFVAEAITTTWVQEPNFATGNYPS